METQLEALNRNDFLYLLHKGDLMAVLFMTEWCGKCQITESILFNLKTEFDHQIPIYKIDVEKEPDVGKNFGVQTLPTLSIIDRAQVIKTLTGVNPKQIIKAQIARVADEYKKKCEKRYV